MGVGVGVGAPVGGAVPQACWMWLMLRGEWHAPGCCSVHTIDSMIARSACSRSLTRHHPLMFVPFVMILHRGKVPFVLDLAAVFLSFFVSFFVYFNRFFSIKKGTKISKGYNYFLDEGLVCRLAQEQSRHKARRTSKRLHRLCTSREGHDGTVILLCIPF